MSIAVLLPHYKNLVGLEITLYSLSNETKSFELFLIDDGSGLDDEIEALLQKLGLHFEVHLFPLRNNSGITNALNYGLTEILQTERFEYVARIDAGDVCLNDRLSRQAKFMDENPEISLVSCFVRFVDMNRKELFVFKPPLHTEKLKRVVHVYNPFIHPAVLMRVTAIAKLGEYPHKYPALEDHAYFMSLMKSFKAAVIPDVLLEYEMNPKGISLSKRKIQTSSRIKLFRDNFYFGYFPIYGLIRAYLTHITPVKYLTYIKRMLFE
ncbi:MAG: glycosyltransferase involved in cell wall biosynthesis [Parvicella sp.]|jgi:glycosyltransferase involved in cell wall biosynthesis